MCRIPKKTHISLVPSPISFFAFILSFCNEFRRMPFSFTKCSKLHYAVSTFSGAGWLFLAIISHQGRFILFSSRATHDSHNRFSCSKVVRGMQQQRAPFPQVPSYQPT